MSPLPIEAFESVLDEHLPMQFRAARARARCGLYAAAYGAALRGALTRRHRRSLWRQARGMGIDRFEAELLINGACFRAGVVTVNGRTLRLVRGNE